MDESKEEFVERVALEIVNQVRLMHFREGSSASMRTRKLKEIIQSNSKDFAEHVARKNNNL